MLEFCEPGRTIVQDAVANTVVQLTKTNKNVLGFMFGAQKALLHEMVFAGNEMFDRTQAEMHLLSEFASKMAGSHSVEGLKTMGMECAEHQIDFLRRDSERLFKHGERMIGATTNLFNSRSQS